MWEIGQAIHEKQYIQIQYKGMKGSTVKTRKIKPLAIMFSEYYFYLVAFIDDDKVRQNFSVIDDSSPTIYRIDRIRGFRVLDEKFHIPYVFFVGAPGQSVGLLVGGIVFNVTGSKLSDKADEAYRQAKKTEEEVDTICKYLSKLSRYARKFKK